jgi:hypothetical protein
VRGCTRVRSSAPVCSAFGTNIRYTTQAELREARRELQELLMASLRGGPTAGPMAAAAELDDGLEDERALRATQVRGVGSARVTETEIPPPQPTQTLISHCGSCASAMNQSGAVGMKQAGRPTPLCSCCFPAAAAQEHHRMGEGDGGHCGLAERPRWWRWLPRGRRRG